MSTPQDAPGGPPAEVVARLQNSESLKALRELTQVSAQVNPAVARRAGLSTTEVAALELLSQEPVGSDRLAHHLQVTSAATSGIVDRLVARGHAERRPHEADKRRTVVHISESGRAEVVGHLMPMFVRLAQLDAQLDDHEREVVTRYLRGATEALRELT